MEVPMAGFERACLIRGDGGRAIRAALDRIGDKWTLLVVAELAAGRLRPGELQARLPGVSRRMLTRTLRNLERDGLVARSAFAEVPPRVEYELTPLGSTLVEPAVSLAEWAAAHDEEFRQSRRRYDAGRD
jgi:DNA-binding HxlR family transcriptional regulator